MKCFLLATMLLGMHITKGFVILAMPDTTTIKRHPRTSLRTSCRLSRRRGSSMAHAVWVKLENCLLLIDVGIHPFVF